MIGMPIWRSWFCLRRIQAAQWMASGVSRIATHQLCFQSCNHAMRALLSHVPLLQPQLENLHSRGTRAHQTHCQFGGAPILARDATWTETPPRAVLLGFPIRCLGLICEGYRAGLAQPPYSYNFLLDFMRDSNIRIRKMLWLSSQIEHAVSESFKTSTGHELGLLGEKDRNVCSR